MKKGLIIGGLILLVLAIILVISLFFIKEDNKIEESHYKDDKVPVITIKNDRVNIDADTEYKFEDNIEVTFGADGGTVECLDTNLVIGENTITCKALGKNDKQAEVNYTIVVSATYNKSVIYFGDSITAGHLGKPKGTSWVNYIQSNYDLSNSVNAGITDYRVSTYDDRNKWLVTQVRNHYNDSTNYDFVIMQGGINDLLYDTPLGEMSDSFNAEDFDQNTFIGGLELYIHSVVNKWPDARVGYIITYFTPNYVERGIKWSYEDHKAYYDATIKVLDKWNIEYLDFFEGSYNGVKYSELLKVYSKDYLPDYLHLNNAGYELVSSHIYEWMQTLDKYSNN